MDSAGREGLDPGGRAGASAVRDAAETRRGGSAPPRRRAPRRRAPAPGRRAPRPRSSACAGRVAAAARRAGHRRRHRSSASNTRASCGGLLRRYQRTLAEVAQRWQPARSCSPATRWPPSSRTAACAYRRDLPAGRCLRPGSRRTAGAPAARRLSAGAVRHHRRGGVERRASELRDGRVRVELALTRPHGRRPAAARPAGPRRGRGRAARRRPRWCCAPPGCASRHGRPRVTRRPHRRASSRPEVVQTSAMDCGPASLKCLLEGLRHPRQLRAAARGLPDRRRRHVDRHDRRGRHQLGLDAEQIVVPADHLLLPEAASLPAIVVVRLADGVDALRRRLAPPRAVRAGDGSRRRAALDDRASDLLDELYLHAWRVPAADWREWAATAEFLGAAARAPRARSVSGGAAAGAPSTQAPADRAGAALGALDAATRMVASLVDAGGPRRGREARRVVERLDGGRSATTRRAGD